MVEFCVGSWHHGGSNAAIYPTAFQHAIVNRNNNVITFKDPDTSSC